MNLLIYAFLTHYLHVGNNGILITIALLELFTNGYCTCTHNDMYLRMYSTVYA